MVKAIWNLDPAHSEVTFKVKHMMITNVTGSFGKFHAEVETDGDDFSTSNVTFSAETGSVNTGNEQRDGHLRSGDFFDAENHPVMKFVSSRLEKKDEENYILHGDLTIRGTSRPVRLNAAFGGVGKDPWGNTKAGFTISGSINRSEWNLVWNAPLEAGGWLVSEEVKLNAEIQLTKGN